MTEPVRELRDYRECTCGHRPGWHVDLRDPRNWGRWTGQPLVGCAEQGCECPEYREAPPR